jgi:hypothetical protein
MTMEKGVVRAVHDDDLETYLKSLGLFFDLQAGRIKCKFCRQPVTVDTLHALLPESGAIHAICSRPECVKLLMQHLIDK